MSSLFVAFLQAFSYQMTLILRMEDKMNRQLSSTVIKGDDAMTLADELVRYGFINEVWLLHCITKASVTLLPLWPVQVDRDMVSTLMNDALQNCLSRWGEDGSVSNQVNLENADATSHFSQSPLASETRIMPEEEGPLRCSPSSSPLPPVPAFS